MKRRDDPTGRLDIAAYRIAEKVAVGVGLAPAWRLMAEDIQKFLNRHLGPKTRRPKRKK